MQTIIQNQGDVIYVCLGESDLAWASEIAQKRFDFYGGENYRGAAFQEEKFDIGLHKIGAASELATALALSIPWTGDIKQDVGPFEVKAVTEPHHRLFIPQKDRHRYSPRFKERVYISVENVAMTPARFLKDWRVRGWAYAGDLYRKDECLESLMNEQRAPVYVLPNKLLRPMNTLPTPSERPTC